MIRWTGGGNAPAATDWVKIGDWYYYIFTSKGLKTGAEAMKLGLGGEVLCYVW